MGRTMICGVFQNRRQLSIAAAVITVTALLMQSAVSQTTATSSNPLPPPEIHICDAECATLFLTTDKRGYATTRGISTAPPNTVGGYWINRFDASGVEIFRVHPTGQPGMITGQIDPNGSRMFGKTIWSLISYKTYITWGELLDTIPGSGESPGVRADRERARARQLALAMPVPSACEKKSEAPQISMTSPPDLQQIALCECEAEDCPGAAAGFWTLSGTSGLATWPTYGSIGELRVERFDQGQVVIRMRSMTSNIGGLTSIYTGTIHGNEIDGDVTHTWRGFKGGVERRHWHAYIANAEERAALVDRQNTLNNVILSAEYQSSTNALGLLLFAIGNERELTPEERQNMSEANFKNRILADQAKKNDERFRFIERRQDQR